MSKKVQGSRVTPYLIRMKRRKIRISYFLIIRKGKNRLKIEEKDYGWGKELVFSFCRIYFKCQGSPKGKKKKKNRKSRRR